MTLSKKLMASGLAALVLLATSAAAMAAPAFATGNVNVRSGPGTGYGVIDVLRRGEQVDVQQCRGSWCFVERRGVDGWVSSSYLNSGRPGGGWDDGYGRPPYWDPTPSRPPHWNPRPPRPPHWNPGPPPRPQPWPPNNGGSVCFNGPNGYFCIGN